MRLVLDTNVVVSALFWGGTPRLLLEAGRARRAELFTSTPLLAELTDVLNRRKFERKIAASLLTVDQIVDSYAALTSQVRPELTPRIAADPDDDVVIGTALAAKADLIVSGDSHLLGLGAYREVLIVTAANAVEQLIQAGTEAL
jgi:putative PIN family toxin of toxin-antitoxin system